MTALPAIPTMLWHALPPEVTTSRLMAGAGAIPMLQAAAGWEALAISLETQADELAGSLAALAGAWSGGASEQAVNSTTPMVIWLRTVAMQAMKRAMQAIAQAESYGIAMTTTPPLPEIEQNHVTHGVLEGTNFLGVNTVPIGMNEADYFIRMWNQAAAVMDGYQAETTLNTVFEPIVPMTPIVMPGVGEAATAAGMAGMAAMAPGAAMRSVAMAHVSVQSTAEIVALNAGRAGGAGNQAAQTAQGQAQKSEHQGQQTSNQGMQMMSQAASQLTSMAVQLPQQATQMVTQPIQQLTGPLQQMTSIFGSMNSHPAQMGLMGASPFSNHPLVGGTGPGSGAGLVRAASVPGSGGLGPRTPALANLVGETAEVPAPGAGASPGGSGPAPVNAGSGGPMGHAGRERGKSGGTRTALLAPTVLRQDLDEDEGDDW